MVFIYKYRKISNKQLKHDAVILRTDRTVWILIFVCFISWLYFQYQSLQSNDDTAINTTV